jgi:hypothetical protein
VVIVPSASPRWERLEKDQLIATLTDDSASSVLKQR